MKRPGAVTEQMEGKKEGGRERESDGRGETERGEKLMSRLLCDGACLLHCQAASLHTAVKTPFLSLRSLLFSPLLFFFFSGFLYLLFVSVSRSLSFSHRFK